MSSPSSSLATLRPDLGQSFEEFDLSMDAQGFIANRVLPVVEVTESAGKFGIIPLEQILKESDTKRASSGAYPRDIFTFTDSSYSTSEYGQESPVDDRNAKMYAQYIDAEQAAAARARDRVIRGYEKRVADMIYNGTTWSGGGLTTGVGNEWDDLVNATPIADVEAAVRKVYDGTGLWPNALVVNRKVFRNLRNCEEILERINSEGAGNASKASDVTADMLAKVFDLKYILVGGSSRNTAKEGQTATPAQIWSDEYAMVCKVAETNDFAEACIGRTFHWGADGSNIAAVMETYRDETVRGNVVRARFDVDELVLYPQLGHLLSNITA
jgi:hypothetical protein